VNAPSKPRNRPLQSAEMSLYVGERRSREGSILDKSPDEERSRKELAQEKRERTAAEGKSAMAEIAARKAFIAKNTIRLRELRLAKEAADREAQAALPPEPAVKPARKKAVRSTL
jgi:hypothetical protein